MVSVTQWQQNRRSTDEIFIPRRRSVGNDVNILRETNERSIPSLRRRNRGGAGFSPTESPCGESPSLDRLAVGGFEADPLVHEVVHNDVIELLDVAENAEAGAARHGQARRAFEVQCDEGVVRCKRDVGAVEVENHSGVGRIGDSGGGEAVLEPIE